MHVLVVDDSAVVRHTVSALLGQETDLSVETASDPFIAMHKMESRRPDVILLDIEMPRMDGLTFLGKIMAEDPIPVVICSALTGAGLNDSVRALELGAVDVVAKPKVGLQEFLYESSVTLLDSLRAAARARVKWRTGDPACPDRQDCLSSRNKASGARATRAGLDPVIAVGASTGGTDALRELLMPLPADAPAILIVQHMPEAFTGAFARRLNEQCAVEVREAVDGDPVCAGQAYVAPGNRHMQIQQTGSQYVIRIVDGPLVSRHRPSVNVLFASVARTVRDKAIGVILTGMGDDGADGLLQMKRAGAKTIAQDEKTSVVFGMPGKAIARGGADTVLPLDQIGAAILER